MNIDLIKKELEDNKADIIERAKAKAGEDLKPQSDDVLLEDDDKEMKVYMNTWKNYNEYGADLVMYDNIDGWMTVDEAIKFCEEHADDEPFINDTENVPFEVSEYDVAYRVLDELKQLEDMEGYDRKMLERVLSTGDYDFEDALEIVENGDYAWYEGVSDDAELGYAIADEFGGPREMTSNAENYIDEDALRRDLSLDVRDMYYDTAKDEVEYEHRFDEKDDYDLDAEIEQWLDDHEDELLDGLVDEVISGDIDTDMIENYFDYERFGRDVAIENNVYYLDDGALEIIW